MPAMGQQPAEHSAAGPTLQNAETAVSARGQFGALAKLANTIPSDALVTSSGQALTDSTGTPLTTN